LTHILGQPCGFQVSAAFDWEVNVPNELRAACYEQHGCPAVHRHQLDRPAPHGAAVKSDDISRTVLAPITGAARSMATVLVLLLGGAAAQYPGLDPAWKLPHAGQWFQWRESGRLLTDSLRREADQLLAARRAAVADLQGEASWAARRADVRGKFAEVFGRVEGQPASARSPLHARVRPAGGCCNSRGFVATVIGPPSPSCAPCRPPPPPPRQVTKRTVHPQLNATVEML
jgi:hypothetical protein